MKSFWFFFSLIVAAVVAQDPTGENSALNNTQELGTGIDDSRDQMDICANAAGPRIPNSVFSPGRTNVATVDKVNGGYCGVEIDQPGIWWWIEGTGGMVVASTCHVQTTIRVKMSVFTGSCDDLVCVTGGDESDYECPLLRGENDLGEWNTMSTALTFPTELGKNYYVLVQQFDDTRGDIWLNFRVPIIPPNDDCVDAIGPVPRDMTRVLSSTVDATKSYVEEGYCFGDALPALYPGTWFQVIGTGGSLEVMACSVNNFDGYTFSVYGGEDGTCDSLECVSGQFSIGVEDPEKCTFGQISRTMTKFKFQTVDRNRYFIYVHFARTVADKPTGDMRFFVDDGESGEDGTSGAHIIEYTTDREEVDTGGNTDAYYNHDKKDKSDNGSTGDNSEEDNKDENESSGLMNTNHIGFGSVCTIISIGLWMINLV